MIEKLKKEISRLKKEIGQLHGMIETDSLTGLYNRHGFIKRAEGFLKSIEWGEKHHKERRDIFYIKDFTIVFIDLDNFKFINDTFGHKAGDVVIKEIADVLKINTKEVDVLCRWGGDEFVLGLVGVGERTGAAIAERLRRKIAGHKFATGKGIARATASFGVASALQCYKQTKSINLYRLIEEADEAMYEVKKKLGKNFVASYHKVKR
ncbi:MAG: GGDEF domain-containing protein [Candidatus Terrybacteria bacterium]|nr:GGDEF domain-containing protein [Candidatus Terrybacteria bacterium]